MLLIMVLVHGTLKSQMACDLVINEILFNPPRNGSDYIELYNRSSVPVDLSAYLLANRNTRGEPASIKKIGRSDRLLQPGNYAVITSDSVWLKTYYFVPGASIIIEISSLPSWPDDEGSTVLIRAGDSSVCDEVSYSEKWHFSLIDEPTGVALERVNFDEASQNRFNWASASSASGFGTPGRPNSQQRLGDNSPSDILRLSPKQFTPDNDGLDDFLQISVTPSGPGYVANSIIYDVHGRRAKYLLKNESLGTSNIFRWDGQDDRNRNLPPGVYIMVTDIFNMQGHAKKFKNVIVIGYRSP
jgi:hypothetical protein